MVELEIDTFIGARLVLFCDTINTDTGWIITNGGTELLVDNASFPNTVHFELMAGGGGVTERWTSKDTGLSLSGGDVKLEFKFDFQLMDASGSKSPSGFSIFLQEQNIHPVNSTGSRIGCVLGETHDLRHHLYGVVTDGATSTSSIQGGFRNQRTTHVYPPNQDGADGIVDPSVLGPYWITVELKDNKFRMSIFLDESKTIHARGSPREVDATGINPANLKYLVIANDKGQSASESHITADLDSFYITKNEPITPLSVNTQTATLIEDWENSSEFDQNPEDWVSAIDPSTEPSLTEIREVSTEQPNDGVKSFKLHTKFTGNGNSTNMRASVIGKRIATLPNPNGGELLIPHKFTAKARSDIMNAIGDSTSRGGVYITYELIEGSPISQTNTPRGFGFTMFKDTVGSGGTITAFNDIESLFAVMQNKSPETDSTEGSYFTLESNMKTIFQSDGVFDGDGLDFESHVKSISIGYWIDTSATSSTFNDVEALMYGDEINLLPATSEVFGVDAILELSLIKEKSFFVNKHIKGFGLEKGFNINALIQSLGDDGNNGGVNPFIIQPIGDGFFTVPVGTLVGQRMTLPSAPVRIVRIEFVARRGGLTGAPTGTLVGKIRRNTIPLERIATSDEILSSTNTINIADITTSQSGQTIAFDFDPVDPEVTETELTFVGFEVEGANDSVLIETNSDPNTILGGDVIVEEPCSTITNLRSDRLGNAIFNDEQFSQFHLRPLRDISSSPIPVGETITHIRVQNGDGGTSKFTMAIYEGSGTHPIFQARTPEISFVGVPPAQEITVPLLSPYVIGTSVHANIWVCIAVNPNLDQFGDPQPPPGHNRPNPALSFWSNDGNHLRHRITYSSFDNLNTNDYPNFPTPTFDAPQGVTTDGVDTPYFQLLGPNVNSNNDTCWSPDQGEDAVLKIIIDEELRQRGVAKINAILIQGTKELEFFMGARVVFRTAVNCTCPNALLQAQDQEEEFFINAILTKVGVFGKLPLVNALIKSIGGVSGSYIPTTFTINAILQFKGLTSPVIINAFIQDVNQVESFIGARVGVPIEKTFSLGAKVGVDEPQSILDVESVIGHKAGLQS